MKEEVLGLSTNFSDNIVETSTIALIIIVDFNTSMWLCNINTEVQVRWLVYRNRLYSHDMGLISHNQSNIVQNILLGLRHIWLLQTYSCFVGTSWQFPWSTVSTSTRFVCRSSFVVMHAHRTHYWSSRCVRHSIRFGDTAYFGRSYP